MRQHKAGERKAAQRWSFRTQKARTAPPCSRAAGRNRALRAPARPGAPSAQTFGLLRRAPLGESIACTERRFHTCARAAGEKNSTDGQEAHSKLKKEVKKGSWSVRMARGRSYLQCLGARRAAALLFRREPSPQCASSHDCGTHLSGTVWLGRNMLLSWSPQCAQPSSLYTITCHGPRQGC